MTTDDYKQLLLLKLIDVNLDGMVYVMVDGDGEIVISKYEMICATNAWLQDDDIGAIKFEYDRTNNFIDCGEFVLHWKDTQMKL